MSEVVVDGLPSQPILTGGKPHRVVIIGGGAAGLELAARIGRRKQFSVTLVDKARTHVWKPKLHEIAAGSMDAGRHEVGFLAHARRHGYTFRMGELSGLDRAARKVSIAAYVDSYGEQVTPQRDIAYDTLVLAIGSQSNDFGTPGVAEYALRLESLQDAEHFNRRLTNACFRAQAQTAPLDAAQLRICIIGAGATGVELAAELHCAGQEILGRSSGDLSGLSLQIHLVEAADRILPALAPKVSAAARKLLQARGIHLHTTSKVARVDKRGVFLADGQELPSELTVWAAGVKAPEILRHLDGLETTRSNQLTVLPTLQTSLDANVFALGDCAACPKPDGSGFVPPRAQAANQQANFLATSLECRLAGNPLPSYTYRDFGSLISLGGHTTVGALMGGLVGPGLFVEGLIAKVMYMSLYKKHEAVLHGWWRVGREALARTLSPFSGSRVKLH